MAGAPVYEKYCPSPVSNVYTDVYMAPRDRACVGRRADVSTWAAAQGREVVAVYIRLSTRPGLDSFLEPLNVQPVGAPPPLLKPGAHPPPPASEPADDDE